jgi:hypothetical protein
MIQYKEPREGTYGGVSKGEFRPIPANYKEIQRRGGPVYRDTPWSFCPCLTHSGGFIGQSLNHGNKKMECDKYIPGESGGVLLEKCIHFSGTLCMLSAVEETEMVKQTKEKELPLLIGYLKTKPGIKALEERFRDDTIENI